MRPEAVDYRLRSTICPISRKAVLYQGKTVLVFPGKQDSLVVKVDAGKRAVRRLDRPENFIVKGKAKHSLEYGTRGCREADIIGNPGFSRFLIPVTEGKPGISLRVITVVIQRGKKTFQDPGRYRFFCIDADIIKAGIIVDQVVQGRIHRTVISIYHFAFGTVYSAKHAGELIVGAQLIIVAHGGSQKIFRGKLFNGQGVLLFQLIIAVHLIGMVTV